jgi:hypothetical protein
MQSGRFTRTKKKVGQSFQVALVLPRFLKLNKPIKKNAMNPMPRTETGVEKKTEKRRKILAKVTLIFDFTLRTTAQFNTRQSKSKATRIVNTIEM